MSDLLFSFSGRINRQPFWLSLIVIALVQVVLYFAIGIMFGADVQETTTATSYSAEIDLSTMNPLGLGLTILVSLIFLWPGLAIHAKRWHDRGKSAWWILIVLIPVVGGIWALVETGFLRGTVGDNAYGPDPLAA